MKTLRSKIAGALYGVAIGDALGAPLEFMSTDQIIQEHGRVTEMIGGGWLNVVPGETTDDTAMTLAVAEGIIENPNDPIPAIGERFIDWAHSGPKDIGTTCLQSIRKAAGMAPRERLTKEQWFSVAKDTEKENGDRSGGNGALMRTVYPGLYYKDLSAAVEMAGDIAQMTHWDIKSTKACKLYTKIIYLITEVVNKEEAIQIIRDVLKESEYSLKNRRQLKPTGYVVDSFNCALHNIAATGTFEEAIIEAANLGGDADTIAAITGGLAGAIYGYNEIPQRWITTLTLETKTQLDKLIDVAVENKEKSVPESYQKN